MARWLGGSCTQYVVYLRSTARGHELLGALCSHPPLPEPRTTKRNPSAPSTISLPYLRSFGVSDGCGFSLCCSLCATQELVLHPISFVVPAPAPAPASGASRSNEINVLRRSQAEVPVPHRPCTSAASFQRWETESGASLSVFFEGLESHGT